MRTTLHNHKFIDTEDKPLIKNIDFKKLIEAAQFIIKTRHLNTLTIQQNFILDDILLGEKSQNKRINHPEIFK